MGTNNEVKVWMIRQDLRIKDVAAKAGVGHSTVSAFMGNFFASSNLVNTFIELGCPARYFKNGRVSV